MPDFTQENGLDLESLRSHVSIAPQVVCSSGPRSNGFRWVQLNALLLKSKPILYAGLLPLFLIRIAPDMIALPVMPLSPLVAWRTDVCLKVTRTNGRRFLLFMSLVDRNI